MTLAGILRCYGGVRLYTLPRAAERRSECLPALVDLLREHREHPFIHYSLPIKSFISQRTVVSEQHQSQYDISLR